MAKRRHAMLFAMLLSFLGPLAWFADAIIALSTLRFGAAEGLYCVFAAGVPNIISVLSTQQWWFLGRIVTNCLLVWLMALLLRRQRCWMMLLQLSALVGLAIVVLAHALQNDMAAWWQHQLTRYLNTLRQALPELSTAMNGETIAQFSRLATGVLLAKIMLNGVLKVLFARYCQAQLYNPGGLRQELTGLRLDKTSVGILLMVAFLAFTGNRLALDSLPMAMLPFFLTGVIGIHHLAHAYQLEYALIVFYILLVLLFPYMVILLAILAASDSCFNIMAHWRARAKS